MIHCPCNRCLKNNEDKNYPSCIMLCDKYRRWAEIKAQIKRGEPTKKKKINQTRDYSFALEEIKSPEDGYKLLSQIVKGDRKGPGTK